MIFSKLASAIFLLVFLQGCSDSEPIPGETLFQGSTMGTSWSVKVFGIKDTDNPVNADLIQARLDEIETAISNWIPESEISSFNRSKEGCAFIGEDTEKVARMAEQISLKSLGYFDPTVSPMIELWGFGVGNKPPEQPSDQSLAMAREISGYDYIWVVDGKLCKSIDEVQVNYSAIAKGYAVDALTDLLNQQGHRNYLVEVGGELFGLGVNKAGNQWRIGVERPSYGLTQGVQSVLSLDGLGVATSGDYRNYYELDGVRYSHIIDPKTGRPVIHNTASVTVLDPSVMVADAWATALLSVGVEKGMALAEKNNLAVLMIVHDGDDYKEFSSSFWPVSENSDND